MIQKNQFLKNVYAMTPEEKKMLDKRMRRIEGGEASMEETFVTLYHPINFCLNLGVIGMGNIVAHGASSCVYDILIIHEQGPKAKKNSPRL